MKMSSVIGINQMKRKFLVHLALSSFAGAASVCK
jgi:hypothetical protein